MRTRLKRRAFFVDQDELRAARRALGTDTDAETIRAALREVSRMKALARFMERSKKSLPPGSFSPI
jgi:hypothetical protein